MEQYLFHQFRSIPNGNAVSKQYHSHEFWQVDFITAGNGCLHFKNNSIIQSIEFVSGDTIMIPPGIEHWFAYCDQPSSWLSVKFISAVQGVEPLLFSQENILDHAMHIIAEVLSPHFKSRTASLTIVNAALSVVTGRLELELKSQRTHTSEFVRQVKEFVYAQQGNDVRISDIGEKMNCSGKHASLRFKQECGISLKTFLDQTRADLAGRLLRTSNKSLNEIARQLGFRDVYAFSRFFRRVMNDTLSGYRNRKSDSR